MEGVLDVGEELAALADEEEAAAEQVAGGTHARRIDVGHGEHAAAEQPGDLARVDPVVLGLAAVDGLHVEGVAEDEGDVLGAEVGEPVPAEDALGGDDQVVAEGFDGFEEELGLAGQVAVQQDVAAPVLEDAEVHGAGVEVDAAVVSMLASVEAHGSPPGLDECSRSHRSSRLPGGPGGACISIKCASACAASGRSGETGLSQVEPGSERIEEYGREPTS